MNYRNRLNIKAVAAALSLASVLLGGCVSVNTLNSKYDTTFGKKRKVTNVHETKQIPAHLRRVAMLPVYKGSYDYVDMSLVEENFVQELGKLRVFEVVAVSSEQLNEMFGVEAFSSVEILPTQLLSRLYEAYAIDGVMFVDITYYKPYQPVGIGARAKLLDGHTGEIVWAADETFDASDPAVSNAARKYFQTHSVAQYPLQKTQTVLHSSARFSKYVASALFGTLKPSK